MKIELTYPIEIIGTAGTAVKCKELEMQRIKLKHLKLLPEDFVEKGENIHPAKFIPLIAGLVGITEDEAGEIDFADLQKMTNVITDFLAVTPDETTSE